MTKKVTLTASHRSSRSSRRQEISGTTIQREPEVVAAVLKKEPRMFVQDSSAYDLQ
jgi:hypothetical protein